MITSVEHLLYRAVLTAAVLCFGVVVAFGFLTGALAESVLLKGVVALLAIGAVGWLAMAVLRQLPEVEAPTPAPKGSQIDVVSAPSNGEEENENLNGLLTQGQPKRGD